MILVDTSVWVRATQQKGGSVASELDALIDADEVATTDLVIAEVLQGTSSREEFEKYESRMEALHYLPMHRETWLRAAALSFQLRRSGMTTPLADLAIATVALDNDLEIFAIDSHFERVPSLRLHAPATAEREERR